MNFQQFFMHEKLFITIEGVDGSGKTSTAKELAHRMHAEYLAAPTGYFKRNRKRVDQFLEKGPPYDIADLQARFRFYVFSNLALSQEIANLLKTKHVVCDRFRLSTEAPHRAMGLNVSHEDEDRLKILKPDLTVVLTAEMGRIERRLNDRGNRKPYETKELLTRMDQEYRKAVNNKDSILIDTTDHPVEDVVSEIHDFILKRFHSF